jgi:hypothetical protein
VLYGGKYLDWDWIISVITAFAQPDTIVLRQLVTRVDESHGAALPNGLFNGMAMGGFRKQFRAGETMKLHEILRSCVTFHATEPKDKIFALQGITEEASHPSLPIDYNLEVPRILMNTARYFLQTPQSLQILQLAGIGWERDRKTMPSWVVDWTMTRPSSIVSYSNLDNSPTAYKAATQMPPHVHYDPDKFSLEMKGLYFDEIDELGEAIHFFDLYKNESLADLQVINRMWVSWFRRAEDISQRRVPDPYHTGQPRLEAFWRTMICDKDTSRPASPENYFNYLDFRETSLKDHVEGLKNTSSEREILTESEQKFLRDRDKDPRPPRSAHIGLGAFGKRPPKSAYIGFGAFSNALSTAVCSHEKRLHGNSAATYGAWG